MFDCNLGPHEANWRCVAIKIINPQRSLIPGTSPWCKVAFSCSIREMTSTKNDRLISINIFPSFCLTLLSISSSPWFLVGGANTKTEGWGHRKLQKDRWDSTHCTILTSVTTALSQSLDGQPSASRRQAAFSSRANDRLPLWRNFWSGLISSCQRTTFTQLSRPSVHACLHHHNITFYLCCLRNKSPSDWNWKCKFRAKIFGGWIWISVDAYKQHSLN